MKASHCDEDSIKHFLFCSSCTNFTNTESNKLLKNSKSSAVSFFLQIFWGKWIEETFLKPTPIG